VPKSSLCSFRCLWFDHTGFLIYDWPQVNIVPVIAKSDCLTQKEISQLKRKILQEIQDNGIKIYSLPDCDRFK